MKTLDDVQGVGVAKVVPTYLGLPTMLKAGEVAWLLRCPKKTVLELARRGEIEGRKVGGEWRFKRAVIAKLTGKLPPGEMAGKEELV